ncbi:hypothetical protein BGZ80_010359 [Entomortierella chlamydospora]|uniref:Arsenate reductase n=1 Tax=Entomortierella chlamydospora TaxID=101097 RepID=A0A9P6MW74_9FUNG|nr:hypothetical protein BGZ79_010286 [Entomortierella chlamydospora]KAG0014591.1 hypothetical protein BGZ80_010359 [Entomortierella chlamydospora]
MPKLPIISIYHNPSLVVSKEALKLLKAASNKHKFKVDLIQAKSIPPTPQQILNMVHYLGNGSLKRGITDILVPEAPKASTIEEVQKILSEKPAFLRKPLIVDWSRGKAIIADPAIKVKEFVQVEGDDTK